MLNIPHASTLAPKSRDFFWACIGFLFAVFAVLMFFIVRESRLVDEWRGSSVAPREAKRALSSEEQLRKIATETKQLTGTIEQVTTLKESDTKYLRIRAFVIDREKIDEVDAKAPSVELPTTEEVFDVVVNEKTELRGGIGQDAIRSGDFVSIVTAENIYDAKRLTAVSLEKFSGTATEGKNKR